MRMFSKFNVYESNFTYDEMKVMALIVREQGADCLDYEDLVIICKAVYDHWIDGRDVSEDEKYKKYPWLEFETDMEDGYIQEYASRVLKNFIKLYKELREVAANV